MKSVHINHSEVNVLVRHFGEYACLFSCQELDEEIDTTFMSVC